jgi:hypothetical protein
MFMGFSAGSHPKGAVHPVVLDLRRRAGGGPRHGSGPPSSERGVVLGASCR